MDQQRKRRRKFAVLFLLLITLAMGLISVYVGIRLSEGPDIDPDDTGATGFGDFVNVCGVTGNPGTNPDFSRCPSAGDASIGDCNGTRCYINGNLGEIQVFICKKGEETITNGNYECLRNKQPLEVNVPPPNAREVLYSNYFNANFQCSMVQIDVESGGSSRDFVVWMGDRFQQACVDNTPTPSPSLPIVTTPPISTPTPVAGCPYNNTDTQFMVKNASGAAETGWFSGSQVTQYLSQNPRSQLRLDINCFANSGSTLLSPGRVVGSGPGFSQTLNTNEVRDLNINLQNGSYSFRCEHTDFPTAGGCNNTDSFSISLTTPTPTPTSPPQNLPPSCSNLSATQNGLNVNLSCTATDPDGTVASVQFYWAPQQSNYCDAGSGWTLIGNGTQGANNVWSYTWNTTGLSTSNITIAANVFDNQNAWCTGNPSGTCGLATAHCPSCSVNTSITTPTPTPTPTPSNTPTPTPTNTPTPTPTPTNTPTPTATPTNTPTPTATPVPGICGGQCNPGCEAGTQCVTDAGGPGIDLCVSDGTGAYPNDCFVDSNTVDPQCSISVCAFDPTPTPTPTPSVTPTPTPAMCGENCTATYGCTAGNTCTDTNSDTIADTCMRDECIANPELCETNMCQLIGELTVVKSVTEVCVGDASSSTLSYTIVVTNPQANTRTIDVIDDFSAGLTPYLNQSSINPAATVVEVEGSRIVWNDLTINGNSQRTFTYNLTVPSAAFGSHTNTVTIYELVDGVNTVRGTDTVTENVNCIPPTGIVSDDSLRIIAGVMMILLGSMLYKVGAYRYMGDVFWKSGGRYILSKVSMVYRSELEKELAQKQEEIKAHQQKSFESRVKNSLD